jgi:hypothetical protein
MDHEDYSRALSVAFPSSKEKPEHLQEKLEEEKSLSTTFVRSFSFYSQISFKNEYLRAHRNQSPKALFAWLKTKI